MGSDVQEFYVQHCIWKTAAAHLSPFAGIHVDYETAESGPRELVFVVCNGAVQGFEYYKFPLANTELAGSELALITIKCFFLSQLLS